MTDTTAAALADLRRAVDTLTARVTALEAGPQDGLAGAARDAGARLRSVLSPTAPDGPAAAAGGGTLRVLLLVAAGLVVALLAVELFEEVFDALRWMLHSVF